MQAVLLVLLLLNQTLQHLAYGSQRSQCTRAVPTRGAATANDTVDRSRRLFSEPYAHLSPLEPEERGWESRASHSRRADFDLVSWSRVATMARWPPRLGCCSLGRPAFQLKISSGTDLAGRSSTQAERRRRTNSRNSPVHHIHRPCHQVGSELWHSCTCRELVPHLVLLSICRG